MSRDGATPILFTIPNFRTAGSGRVLYNCVTSLDRELWEPRVAVLEDGGELADRLSDQGIPVLVAPFCIDARPYASLAVRLLRAAREFRPHRPTIWHSFHYRDDYTEPMIARLSGAGAWLYTKKAMGWGSRGWLTRSYLANRIIVDNSDMIGTMFDRRGLRGRTRLVPHGVHAELFADAEPRQPSLREQLGIAASTPLVVSVAELVPVKGHVDLIRALRELPTTHLALAGRDPSSEYGRELAQLAQDLRIDDRIHFLGQVGNVPALLKEADVFVLATRSRGEGCPVALLEAMAAGVPCIATEVPGSRDVLADSANGLLVPAEDSHALADGIDRLTSDRRLAARLGAAASAHVRDHYTVEREVEALQSVYEELLR